MPRHRLRVPRIQRARMRAAASALEVVLGWRRNQADAFLDVLAASTWRHCRQSEPRTILARCSVLMCEGQTTNGAAMPVGDVGGARADKD